MPDDILRDKIQDWLRGRLSGAEAAALQAKAEADPEFAHLVEQERLYLEALELLFKKKLANNLARWRLDPDNIPPPPDFTTPAKPNAQTTGNRLWRFFYRSYKFWLAGVALLTLGLLAWLFWLDPTPASFPPDSPNTPIEQQEQPVAGSGTEQEDETEKPNQQRPIYPLRQLAVNLHQPEYTGSTRQSANTGSTEIRAEADSASAVNPADPAYRFRLAQDTLKSGHAAAAIALLQPLVLEDSLASDLHLWLGHAWFKSGKFEEAITAYRRFEALTERTDYADWYLLLSYLAVYPEHKQAFDELLTKITKNPKHRFYNEANQLKSQLGKSGNR
ncbi:MAG: hypothetical protein H6574_16080 [Lewinellaceae bacterium]|nr:hypothetical protein [Lewinellaceae bacterium]